MPTQLVRHRRFSSLALLVLLAVASAAPEQHICRTE
jgi:hypothetical protein